LPVTAGLIVLPREIIEVLFQRGHFNADSARLVTTALIFLVPSIFFYVARDLVTRVFYAFQDSTTPYHIAIVAIFVKAFLDWFLVQYLQLGVAGLSTATTIMTIFNLSLLTFFLRHKIGHLGARLLIKPLATMITASVACAAIIYFAYHGLASVIPGAEVHGALSQMQVIVRLIILSIAGGAGLAAYVFVCLLFRLDEPMVVAKRMPILHRYLPSKRSD